MANISSYLKNALINGVLRNTQYTVPAKVYLALYVGDPSDSGVESAVGGYARQEITFAAPSGGVSTNSADVTFPTVTSGSETITHFAIFDSLTTGNLLFYGELTLARSITVNNRIVFQSGELSVTLA